MSQGFNPHRHRSTRADASRWAPNGDIDPIPTFPGIQRVLIESLRARILLMARTKKQKHFARVTLPTNDDSEALRTIIEDLLGLIEQLDRTTNKQFTARIRLYVMRIAVRDQYPDELIENCFRLKLGHWEDIFSQELTAIAQGKRASTSCLAALLRFQRDCLFDYMNRRYVIDVPSSAIEEIQYLAAKHHVSPDTVIAWLGMGHRDTREQAVVYRFIKGPSIQAWKDSPMPLKVGKAVVWGDGYADGFESLGSWLERNARGVHEELSFYQCTCKYHPDLSNLTVDSIKGPGELIPAILHALHPGLSPASIRQVLKDQSRPGKIPPFLK